MNRMRLIRWTWLAIIILAAFPLALAQDEDSVIVEPRPRFISAVPGDFAYDVTRHSVPLNEIRGGGPTKDGIPALLDPLFVSPASAGRMRPSDMILGVARGGRAKAYPIRILNWHELVNDTIDEQPILVTW